MWFTSDNAGIAHPQVLAALQAANTGYTSGYGAEAAMDRTTARLRDIFEAPEAAVFLVSTGTAANALALGCLCPPWATVYCHRHAHIEEDECGAPEFYTGGAKLTLVDGRHAMIAPADLQAAIEATALSGVHNVQKGALSLTNVTERGAVYALAAIRELCNMAKAADLPVHMDGARFANALVALGCTPAEMTWRAGIDALSFGGTKNGLMGVEAVIFFDPKHAWEFELRRKRGGHLSSKHRYLSAQMDAYLTDDLWLQSARTANARATRLANGLRERQIEPLHPVDANMIFASWDRARHEAVRKAGGQYYYWPGDPAETGPSDEQIQARLVCNWTTTEADIDSFLAALS